MNNLLHRNNPRQAGFSLIEVLIGAVILATGLLALSALQGSLARNAADSRMRSQIAAALERAAETDRASGNFRAIVDSTSAVTVPGLGVVAITGSCGPYTNFTDPDDSDPDCAGKGGTSSQSQYKQIVYSASWLDATGGTRTMSLTSIVSPRTITAPSRLPFDTPTQGVSSIAPIVRSANPEVAGMIPIAIGDGSDTAATNPKPNIVSGNVIRTSYEVLTYKDEGSNIVKQQRRVETAVVGCSCRNNAAPSGAQFERAQWPAYWDGTRYGVYVPSPSTTAAPGTAAGTGPATGVTQDLLCTECCRDHHDNSGDTTNVLFDPYRSGNHSHYKLVAGVLTAAGSGDNYLEVCRMIRVDGFWRTAQDLSAKHFGLLATDANAGAAISSATATYPVPITAAKSAYETFVINYIYANYYPGQLTATADSLYATAGLNGPTSININKPTVASPVDKRYLHARGLYVDKLEPALSAKVVSTANACTRANPVECILPLLAFTSINVTEPAFWSPAAADAADLAVDTDGVILFNPDTPNRGTVTALTTAAAGAADINTRMLKSNSGLAVRVAGIDPDDDVANTDTQAFSVQTTSSVSGRTFTVNVAGWSGSSSRPVPSVVYGTTTNSCAGSNGSYTCTVPSPYDVGAISVAVGGYNYAVTTEKATVSTGYLSNLGIYVSGGCQGSDCTAACPSPDTRLHSTFSKNTVVTMCQNIRVTSVSATTGVAPASFTAAQAALVTTYDGRMTGNVETVVLPFTAIPQGATITINLADETLAIPTKTSCTPATGAVTGGTFGSVCP